jgi:small subunit ribosomal protein S9
MTEYNKGSITVSGKRKRAIAKATIKKGTGEVRINKIPYQNLQMMHRLSIREPLDIAKKILGKVEYDINVNVKGGGQESQVEAARLSIGKALVKVTSSPELKKAFADYDKSLLIADVRRKEPYKPGDSKARSKRQKSFR